MHTYIHIYIYIRYRDYLWHECLLSENSKILVYRDVSLILPRVILVDFWRTLVIYYALLISGGHA